MCFVYYLSYFLVKMIDFRCLNFSLLVLRVASIADSLVLDSDLPVGRFNALLAGDVRIQLTARIYEVVLLEVAAGVKRLCIA